MRSLRRIAEEEYVVLVLLAGFGFVFLLLFPPFLLVIDTWMNLVAGREIWGSGLPRTEELTVYGLGSTWTAQQWLAHLALFSVHSLGGYPLLAVVAAGLVLATFGIGAAASRSLGAGPRAIWVLFVPVVLAAPWAWSIRAQLLALPLYVALLWLLATEARRPTSRVWLALPLLVAWANLHGSVALGALLVVLLAGVELVGSRGASWRRSLPLAALAPLTLLLTPYGPGPMVGYYRLLLLDPPFAGRVTEWMRPEPSWVTALFFALAIAWIPLVAWGRQRHVAYDVLVLAVTLAGALTAIRGVVWFVLACMIFLPVAIGTTLESSRPASTNRRPSLVLSVASAVLLAATVVYSLARDAAWYESNWPDAPVEAVRGAAQPGDRVLADSRYADWLLWRIPELRGRLAFDIRFELYDEEFFDRLQRYGREEGDDWISLADGYRVVVVDETRRSHTDDFLAEPGTKAIFRSDDLTVIVRSREP